MVNHEDVAFNDYYIWMSLLRRAELSIMSYLLKNRTIRLAKKRSEVMKRVSISLAVLIVWKQTEYMSDRMIRESEELSKGKSFHIDGADPFKLEEKDWDMVQHHYMSFYYR